MGFFNNLAEETKKKVATQTATQAAIGGIMATNPKTQSTAKQVASSAKSSSSKTPSSKPSGSNSASTGYYVANTSTKKNPYTEPEYTPTQGLSGVSGSTMAAMSGGYAPSQAVSDALAYLESLKKNAPGEYNDPYADQLDSIYQQIVNRPDFSYDLNGDMLYKQYAQQYQQMGQQAMQDAMGQAAALTGGYGSSYATTAGNQAYQGYLQQLNAMIPEFYQMALQKYQMEGDDLNNLFSLTQGMSDTDYSRWMDTVNRYYTDLSMATDAYNNERSFDYGQYADGRNWAMQQAQMEMSSAESQRQYAYNTVMAMLESGVQPSDALLGMAGISDYDAWAIRNANTAPTYSWVSTGSTSSGNKSSSSGTSSGSSFFGNLMSSLPNKPSSSASSSSSSVLTENELYDMFISGQITEAQLYTELQKLRR